MNFSQVPNLLTISRLALVPLLIVALYSESYATALIIFAVGGISDGLDGFIAKRYHFESRLGAILDPLADKTLLVGAYVMLTVLGHVPFWLMIVVAFRDLLIVGGYLVYVSVVGSVQMRPSRLSKLNTFVQIAFIILILLVQTVAGIPDALIPIMVYIVAATTVASGVHYVWIWGVMKDIEPKEAGAKRQ